jgi:hypothetical protein
VLAWPPRSRSLPDSSVCFSCSHIFFKSSALTHNPHRQAAQEPSEDPHRYRQGQGCQDQEGQVSVSPIFSLTRVVVYRLFVFLCSLAPGLRRECFAYRSRSFSALFGRVNFASVSKDTNRLSSIASGQRMGMKASGGSLAFRSSNHLRKVRSYHTYKSPVFLSKPSLSLRHHVSPSVEPLQYTNLSQFFVWQEKKLFTPLSRCSH